MLMIRPVKNSETHRETYFHTDTTTSILPGHSVLGMVFGTN